MLKGLKPKDHEMFLNFKTKDVILFRAQRGAGILEA